jgi:two-component system chemotaxis response regulator CheY
VIRVAVVDDHRFLVKVLRRTMEGQEDMELICVCERGADALEHLPAAAADVVLLDQVLPDMDGTEVLRRLLAAGVESRFVLFSADLQGELAEEALALGASGCVSKLAGPADVCDVIRRVAAGERIVAAEPDQT